MNYYRINNGICIKIQLYEIWNGDYTFREDALAEMTPLLGMDSENIIL